MLLKTLSVYGFRNYLQEEVSFHPNINCFFGDNAQGKTNLLEALYFLASGRSFRTHHIKELINESTSCFILEASLEKESVHHHLKISYDGKEKSISYNGENYPHFHPLLGIIPLILISPEDIAIIDGAPQKRRRFLDFLLAQINQEYLLHLTKYYRALHQRNALLKTKDLSAITPWEDLMIFSAKKLVAIRLEVLEKLHPLSQNFFTSISGSLEPFSIDYCSPLVKPPLSYAENFYEQFSHLREKELILGQTLIGPHRDDLIFRIGGKNCASFASEGQKRMAVLAVRFAQSALFQEILETKPILAYDDFGAHLDDKRKSWAKEMLKNFGQVIITCPNTVEHGSMTKHFLIEQGRVKACLEI
jgi:DNA replication and repair protein RecF